MLVDMHAGCAAVTTLGGLLLTTSLAVKKCEITNLRGAHAEAAGYLSPEVTNQQNWADSQQGNNKHHVMVVSSKH